MIVVSFALFAIDYYVFRNWRRFARGGRWSWTLPVYQVLLYLMPLAMPLYLYLFSWWEVEPRLARSLFFGVWSIYYVPKVPIVLTLAAKDVVQLLRRRGGARKNSDGSVDLKATSYVRAGSGATHSEPGMSEPHIVAGEPAQPGTIRTDPSNSGPALTRGQFMRRMGWTAASIPFVATGYGVFRTLYDFSVHRVEVPIAGLPRQFEGLTIAQLSDLHAGSLFSEAPMRDAVSIVNGLKPDLIAVTGDFVNHDVAETPLILPGMNDLHSNVGTFGCLGNHDHYANTQRLADQIATTPVQLLVNTHRTLEVDGARLNIIGTDNTGFRQYYADLPAAVQGIQPHAESASILLAHDPTFWDNEVRPNHPDIDLMLCGHTHGGQFGFEFGPIRWSLAQMRYERWAGLYSEPRRQRGPADGHPERIRVGSSMDRDGSQFLYVNRGLGTVGPPLRLGIRPEVTLLTLRRA